MEDNSKQLTKTKKETIRAPPTCPAIQTTIFEKDGKQIIDDYYWLKDRTNKKVLKYLEDENAYAESVMKSTNEFQSTLYDEFIRRTPGLCTLYHFLAVFLQIFVIFFLNKKLT